MIQEPAKLPPMANMNEVIMKKQELIEKLIENKAKHDIVLAAAIQGYWEISLKKTEELKQKFYSQYEEYQGKFAKKSSEFQRDVTTDFDKVISLITGKQPLPKQITSSVISLGSFGVESELNMTYPEDHSKDYERAIQMMKSSIYDVVHLTFDQFDSYVLNNWEWKKNFISLNSAYVNNTRGRSFQQFSSMSTGCLNASTSMVLYSGCNFPYASANDAIYVSGLSVF